MPDNLTKKQRSYCMSRVKNKDTDIEKIVRSELHKRGYRFRKHLKKLPGTPDIAFTRAKVAVFIDGDFWHGYRFSPMGAQGLGFLESKNCQKQRARPKKLQETKKYGAGE